MILPARARGANDRKRIGFIGVGKMGMGHLKWFVNQDDIEIRAIADVEESRREMAKKIVETKNAEKKRGDIGLMTTVDYKDVIASKDIDAVVISTPDHWHTTPLIHAAQAKKDIYCEKPLTLTIEESELAIKAVRKYQVVMQTGSQQRTDSPGFRTAGEYIRSGRIGKIKAINVHFGKTAKFCDLPEQPLAPGLDWERWLGQAPQRPYNELLCHRGDPDKYPFLPGWRDYREYSGGMITDWGCHHIDIVQWVLGMDGSGPTVFMPPAWASSKEKGPDKGGGQFIYKKTAYGDDIVVTHKTYGNGIRFIGEDGELWVNRGELASFPDGILKKPLTDSDIKLENVGPSHRRNWLDCLASRKDPMCRVEAGAGTAAVCHLLNLSYWTGKTVNWNPQTWTITGMPASAKGRKARKGYELPKV